ncbi:MAG: hypothetical protein JNK27_02605 [Chitinophagaceae bacterium]|nr:hypothetical protein [Chitinophagaceae bacterium]
MKYMKWIGLAAAVLLIVSCFTPWVIIASQNIVVSGVDATGTNYGKPGYIHLVLVVFYIVFTLVPRLWAKRANLLVVALNSAWMLRNFLVIATCKVGECPERETGLYLMMISSLLMLLSALFPDIKIKNQQDN